MQPDPQVIADTVIIFDKWGENDEDSEIKLVGSKGEHSFPYEDSSERFDQLKNARELAQMLVANGFEKYIKDQTL